MTEDIIVPVEKPISVQVSVYGVQVILHLSEPRGYIALQELEPVVIGSQLLARAMEADDDCCKKVIDMCMALIDHAYEVRGDLKPAGGGAKHELIERHRRKLTNRYATMLNSMREKKTTSNHGLAKQLVDAALHEIFA